MTKSHGCINHRVKNQLSVKIFVKNIYIKDGFREMMKNKKNILWRKENKKDEKKKKKIDWVKYSLDENGMMMKNIYFFFFFFSLFLHVCINVNHIYLFLRANIHAIFAFQNVCWMNLDTKTPLTPFPLS